MQIWLNKNEGELESKFFLVLFFSYFFRPKGEKKSTKKE